ncbi:MAG TPA: BlaI/MecI/CopY family transcriptional regulator [Candidatus Fournierella merdigallinarum]|nr:BlaI/MecI/CopY family transcriptional regulator [Candidatus Fournierella merdigallinarum]
MGEIKIFDSELLLMEYLWENGPCIAADLAEEFLKRYNWKKSTTYIVLKRLEGKGAISRSYPKYLVTAIVSRQQVQLAETNTLVDRMFGGSFASLFANFLNSDQLSDQALDELQAMIDEKRNKD